MRPTSEEVLCRESNLLPCEHSAARMRGARVGRGAFGMSFFASDENMAHISKTLALLLVTEKAAEFSIPSELSTLYANKTPHENLLGGVL